MPGTSLAAVPTSVGENEEFIRSIPSFTSVPARWRDSPAGLAANHGGWSPKSTDRPRRETAVTPLGRTAMAGIHRPRGRSRRVTTGFRLRRTAMAGVHRPAE
jgi:hypothetical protein